MSLFKRWIVINKMNTCKFQSYKCRMVVHLRKYIQCMSLHIWVECQYKMNTCKFQLYKCRMVVHLRKYIQCMSLHIWVECQYKYIANCHNLSCMQWQKYVTVLFRMEGKNLQICYTTIWRMSEISQI